ncbi:hypothetical protein [Aliiglaciecola sp. LCG003]|uniref:hypothetical protein n=1 Tax=Aliiglaciecola sp. LCG003 TaxID=3053655 RepID=UPI0025739FD1|nr:hypothetical protein [Aliiglaciecola sp. LCG003]WJG08947.1 hypothetical protein QR722_16685 [Aliiglaciecola sp. LCG003]
MLQQIKKRKSNRIPARFIPYSTVLAEQLEELFNRAYDKANNICTDDDTAISMSRLRNACVSLQHILPLALNKVSADTATTIKTSGLNALLDFEIWQELEYYCVNQIDNVKLPTWATRIEEALENLAQFHLEDNKINAPFRLANESISIDIIKLHELKFHQLKEVRALLQGYLDYLVIPELNIKDSTIRDNILKTSSAILTLFQHDSFKEAERAKLPLIATLQDKAFVSSFISNHNFRTFLKFLLPDIWGKARVNQFRTEVEVIEYAYSISPKFGEEMDAFLKNQFANTPEANKAGVRSKTLSFPRWLHSTGNVAYPIVELLSEYGISGLVKNGHRGFKFLYKLYQEECTQNNRQFIPALNAALNLYHFITDEKIVKDSLLPYSMGYYLKESDTTQWQKHKWVYDNANKFYQNLVELHDVFTKRVDGERIGIITLKCYIGYMASALKETAPSLTDRQIKRIASNGIDAFVENNFEILKVVRESIQLKSKQDTLSIVVAKQYQSAIDKLLSFYGLDTINSFPVSTELRSQHQNQLSQNQDKLYSYREVVQLAYFIEIGLSNTLLAIKDKVVLYAAKILLKTGWNLTPTLELDTNDLFFLDTPLHGSKTPAIRLFKRRSNYQTQWYKFEIKAEGLENEGILVGDKVAPVVFDIKSAIKLTTPYPPSSDNLSKRIFVYPETNNIGATDVLVLTANRFKTAIDRILTNLGCDIAFNSQKVRKTGLNYIYRKVSKEFKWYQKAGKHSYETFLRHYLMQDSKDVAKTINRATKTMSDYFVRDVTDNVIILLTPPDDGKKVPNGVCINSKDESAVKAFESQNRKLLDQRGADEQACADFNACLWCPFYRCVADALHVWKLLSYRDFVVADMENSAATFDTITEQLENIEQLKSRVNKVLNDISKLNVQAVIDGKELLRTEGLHPHWKDTGLL